MNHPLEYAQRLIKDKKNALEFAEYWLKHLNENTWRHKAKNKEIRFWKKVKNHIKSLTTKP